MTRFSFILLLTICCSTQSFAQSILLDYQEELLNEILLDLNDRYSVQVSISSRLSNACSVTIKESFSSVSLAMKALGDACGLAVVPVGSVYTFRPREKVVQKEAPPQYLYQGTVTEIGTNERLPFAVVSTSEQNLVTDESGRFSFKGTSASANIKFRSLGYLDVDTVVQQGSVLKISLQPQVMALEDVVVLADRRVAPITNTGEKSGYIQLNDVNNNLVAGLSDNLIFNNLRQYPGIMAAGESIADFVIWGSYAGQNHVTYDGISLFNSWGINDDMGRVNPYMIKHVDVYKGGYNVPYGDRVGGVVLIEGKSGNTERAGANIGLTNQLVSGYVNIPMFNGSSALQLSARKTLTDDLDLASSVSDLNDIIVPKYDYSDYHLKFSAQLSARDQIELSTILSEDSYNGRFRARAGQAVFQNIEINSEQWGGSFKYLRNWEKGGLSSVVISQSKYTPELTTNYFINRNSFNPTVELRAELWRNPILEYRSKVSHTFAASGGHQVQANVEYVRNEADFTTSESGAPVDTRTSELNRLSLYLHDHIQLTDRFSVQLGLKVDVPNPGDEVYWQPRINGQFDISQRWNAHFGWGIYNQFISRNSVVDEIGNRADVWQVANGSTIPVLASNHHVLGLGFQQGDFELSLEGYYKNTSGFTRYFVNPRGESILAIGDARAKGIDLFIRKHINKHVLWFSYSLSKAEDRFGNGVRSTAYRLAPQSQRHELKGTAMFDLAPFQLSVTNVYGSGFSNTTFTRNREDFSAYWRTDLALEYRIASGNQQIDAGVSILNLFNQRNIRLNQSVNVPDGGIVNTLGIPFTPTLYLNIGF